MRDSYPGRLRMGYGGDDVGHVECGYAHFPSTPGGTGLIRCVRFALENNMDTIIAWRPQLTRRKLLIDGPTRASCAHPISRSDAWPDRRRRRKALRPGDVCCTLRRLRPRRESRSIDQFNKSATQQRRKMPRSKEGLCAIRVSRRRASPLSCFFVMAWWLFNS